MKSVFGFAYLWAHIFFVEQSRRVAAAERKTEKFILLEREDNRERTDALNTQSSKPPQGLSSLKQTVQKHDREAHPDLRGEIQPKPSA